MRIQRISWLWALLLFSVFVPQANAQIESNNTPLTNSSVVKLVKANFKEKTIIAIIQSRNSRFDLSPERMIELKRTGVSEKIILAMLAHQQGMDIAAIWDDEPFFNSDTDRKEPERDNSNRGTTTDIFGSSGGLRGSSKSRGGNSSSSGDTVTTGSATVRILRPPSEADAQPKLEKVATLTNQSIVELVEAGFSEGTIVRRIEQSPVDFDLSPPKIAELRKHRVTEKILAAMKIAAGETADATSAPRPHGMSSR